MKNNMNTLLQKAAKINLYRTKRALTDESIELALALIKGEVSYTAVKKTMGLSGGSNVYNFAFSAIKAAYKKGRIKIT